MLWAAIYSACQEDICLAKKKKRGKFIYLYLISLVHQINFLGADSGTGLHYNVFFSKDRSIIHQIETTLQLATQDLETYLGDDVVGGVVLGQAMDGCGR
jgi:hypothetical protein